ncbi:MAG: C25 family cysteine peptidase [Lentimicrobiaceae bacterium]
MHLKKLLLITLVTIISGSLHAQNWVTIHADKPEAASVNLVSGNMSGSVITFELGGYNINPVQTPRGEAFTISIDGATPILEEGMPDLPKITRSLIIPDHANMEATVISSKYIDYPFMDVAPSKGNLTRNINPDDVPYTYGAAYETDEFYPKQIASLREPYILRDYRGQTVVVNPFAYNPVTKTLRVYYQITVEVKANGISSQNVLTPKQGDRAVSIDFKQIYDKHFLNSDNSSRYTPLEEQGKMLIISYGDFMDEMQPFVDWKRTIGIPVEIVDVSTIGANSTAIKNYVAQYYNDNGLTYLLLVGDQAQIPTVTSGSNLGGPSDHAYAYISGDDHYPEIFVGRFSAETGEQVTTQVDRSITYEQNPDISSDWFSKGIGIGSSEGTGDDNEYDWQHMRNIRTKLLAYTYTTVSELYDGSQGGEDLSGNPNSTSVATEVNDGRTIINYTGHGSSSSWGTTGFSNSGVNQLTNNNMWPYIFSVACVNGEFMYGTCFAEAWLRASNINGPTGAVATLMSTINQSWDPPMEGQDAMNEILAENFEENIKRTFGGVAINGCMQMNDAYGADGYEMTDTWLIFGDPSLMLRTALPVQLAVTHPGAAFIGSTQFIVESDVNDALACLTMNDQILGSAKVINGIATITIPALTEVGIMKLAVTAFNHLPYLADIEIIPLDGPYIVYDNVKINDYAANNNQQLDYNETITFALGLKNAGNEDVNSVTVNIRCIDPYVVLNDTTEYYPLITSGQVTSIADGFGLTVSNDVPEGYEIKFEYSANSPEDQWNGTFTLTAHSVILLFAGSSINDEGGNNNGRLDPGETIQLNINILNAGNAPATNVIGELSSVDPYVLINVDSLSYGTINGYQTLGAAFTLTALPTTPSGHQLILDFSMLSDGGFTGLSPLTITVGQIPVLIIDLDGNKNSGPIIRSTLSNIGITSNYITSWPLVIGPYQSVFVCLGTNPANTKLSSAQGQALANFLNNNGRIYMEGGDTWKYDTQTPVHPMFKIAGLADGSGDLANVNGISGTFTEGMSFKFDGDNKYIDRIAPLDTAFSILENSFPEYFTTIAFNGGNYRTIGSSIEFGGLTDGEGASVKDSLMTRFINFFGLSNSSALLANFIASDTKACENESITFTDYSAGNVTSWAWSFPGGTPDTSNEQNPLVSYKTPGIYDVSLTVSDGTNSNTTVKQGYLTIDFCQAVSNIPVNDGISVYPNPGKDHFTVIFSQLTDNTVLKVVSASGVEVFNSVVNNSPYELNIKGLSSGIYFMMISNDNFYKTAKLIVK